MSHTCKALVVHCMDFRFEKGLFEFMATQGLLGNADIVGWAGAGKAFLDEKSQEFALRQIELSHSLHSVCEVHIIQHMDCGGYGGSDAFPNSNEERRFHEDEIAKISALITSRFPDMHVYGYIADKHGESVEVQPVKRTAAVPA